MSLGDLVLVGFCVDVLFGVVGDGGCLGRFWGWLVVWKYLVMENVDLSFFVKDM